MEVNNIMLKHKFKTLCRNFSKEEKLINTLWQEIASEHSHPTRHYHTLKHLEDIYREIEDLELTPLLGFAMFYHDIVYNVKKNDNEEQSALLARERLAKLNVPKELNEKVFKLIMETKTHETSNSENKLFLDADLAVLGSATNLYDIYAQNVREEYAFYSDEIYNTGRKKVLKMFLKKEKIYISQYFYEQYEDKARKNLKQELKKLCSL